MARLLVDGERVTLAEFNALKQEGCTCDIMCEVVGGGDDSDSEASDSITLRVKDQTGEEMFFKVKKGTQLKKVFDAYAGRRGIATTALRFMVDGSRLKNEDTPKMLEMEDNDQIDVMLEALGGGEDGDAAPAPEAPITVKVRDQTGEEMFFKVKKGTEMSKIFNAYAQKRGVAVESLKFMLDGKRVTATDTPKMLEMDEEDQIDVYLEQVGGGEDGDAPAPEAPITVKVRDQAGEEMFFKVKKGTEMSKIFNAYAQKRGVAVESLKFMLDGKRVTATDTPKMLEMDEEDQIDVYLEQVGGGEDGDAPAPEAPITVKVRDQAGEEMFFKVKKGTEMSKIFNAYAQKRGVAVESLKFMLDGKRVTATDTPKMLEMDEEDQIDVYLEQVGGGEDGDAPAPEAPITVKVRDQAGEEMFFKVKKGTEMSKIFNAYAQKRGVAVESLKFMLDGKRVTATDTPKMLEMDEEDQIDVYLEQVGGGEDGEADVKPEDTPITIAVKGQQDGDDVTHFKIKKGTKLQKVFDAYAGRKGVDAKAVRFFFDGKAIQGDNTPKMLEMEDNDQIDAVLAQTGGGGM